MNVRLIFGDGKKINHLVKLVQVHICVNERVSSIHTMVYLSVTQNCTWVKLAVSTVSFAPTSRHANANTFISATVL